MPNGPIGTIEAKATIDYMVPAGRPAMLIWSQCVLICLALSASAAEREVLSSIKPEVEVSASSGSVRLTLRVYKKRFPGEEKLRYQLEIKNIGRKAIRFDGKFFPHPSEISLNEASRSGVYLEILDSKGRPAGTATLPGQGCERERRPLIESHHIRYTEEDSEYLRRKRAEFRRAGLSEHAVSALLLKEKNRLAEKYMPPRPSVPPFAEYELQPGQSVATPPWVCTRYADKRGNAAKPIGQYAQYWEMPSPERGPEFLVRAVYAAQLSEITLKAMRKAGVPPIIGPQDVRVETPPVRIRLE